MKKQLILQLTKPRTDAYRHPQILLQTLAFLKELADPPLFLQKWVAKAKNQLQEPIHESLQMSDLQDS